MQSPINVEAPVNGPEGSTGPNFDIEYKFLKNIPFVVTTLGVEVQVKFEGFTGGLKINYDEGGKMVTYTPKSMVFRFPAEHLINGFRLDGEIILICDEITEDNNKVKIIFLTNLRFSQ